MQQQLNLIGCASGFAGADIHAGDGPLIIQQSPYLASLSKLGIAINWDKMIQVPKQRAALRIDEVVRTICFELANEVATFIKQKKFFTVIGGDHTCAIGTWSGVHNVLHTEGDVGLVWIDAHMDSHTPETTESGRIHGMPLACLLGHGYSTLTSILNHAPKIKPQHLCLIGVRSFERGEAELLQRLQVKIFFMDEIKKRGFNSVFQEAIQIVKRGTIAYGISVDIDSIDPLEAPGVDVPEPDGLKAENIREGITEIISDPQLLAIEIAEFDPSKDKNHVTEELVVSLLQIIANRK